MELQTRLDHIHSEAEFHRILQEHEHVMICCGRMGPMCVPVYAAMEILREKYPGVSFYDMPFDHPEAHVIRNLPQCSGFMGLPYTVYFKHGKVVKATTSIQSREEVEAILKTFF
jgi:thioredoxin 1